MFSWLWRRRLLGRSKTEQRRSSVSLGVLFMGLTAAGLVWLGQQFPEKVAEARARLAGPVSSIVAALQQPLAPLKDLRQRYSNLLKLEDELRQLRAANDELEGWKWRALELERRLADLRALTRVVHEPGVDYVTAVVRARSIGAESNSILVGAGARDGVKAGGGVLNGRGLVGETFEVGRDTSRVRFLIDANFKVVVSIGRRLVTAVAEGSGGRLLDIRDGGRSFEIADGDEVISAGEVGGIPRGLRIGKVVGTASGLKIAPYVDFDRIEHVSLLLSSERRVSEAEVGAGPGERARVTAKLDENGKPVVGGDSQAVQSP
ncbi:MAG: rod shape-determining protein MreC [Alphaproteobacteria bacterium]|nr:rod shape-determining protein MreC [Alphaproteobacteria bacterium]